MPREIFITLSNKATCEPNGDCFSNFLKHSVACPLTVLAKVSLQNPDNKREENKVDVNEVLNALERERELLREFSDLSRQQLALLDDENLDDMSKLLGARSDLMLELTAVESTLGTWISQLRSDPQLTSDVLQELRFVNDEIVRLANEIVELDEQTHCRLDLVKQNSAKRHGRNQGNNMFSGYSLTFRIKTNLN